MEEQCSEQSPQASQALRRTRVVEYFGVKWSLPAKMLKRLFEPRACPPPPSLQGPTAPERNDRLDPGIFTQSNAESDERKELFEAGAPHLLWANFTSHWRTASRLVSSLAEMP